jgi:hypothetical protein
VTIDDAPAQVCARLDLEADREHEVLEEIRGHLEDAVADARDQGIDEDVALAEAVRRFGIEPTAEALKRTHAGQGALDGVLAAGLPVVGVLVLRWLVYAPDGSFGGWQLALTRPAFWIIALICLLIPMLSFGRRRMALASWAIFWALSLVMILGAAVRW